MIGFSSIPALNFTTQKRKDDLELFFVKKKKTEETNLIFFKF